MGKKTPPLMGILCVCVLFRAVPEEIPRLGVKSELQRQILNPLSGARD